MCLYIYYSNLLNETTLITQINSHMLKYEKLSHIFPKWSIKITIKMLRNPQSHQNEKQNQKKIALNSGTI